MWFLKDIYSNLVTMIICWLHICKILQETGAMVMWTYPGFCRTYLSPGIFEKKICSEGIAISFKFSRLFMNASNLCCLHFKNDRGIYRPFSLLIRCITVHLLSQQHQDKNGQSFIFNLCTKMSPTLVKHTPATSEGSLAVLLRVLLTLMPHSHINKNKIIY